MKGSLRSVFLFLLVCLLSKLAHAQYFPRDYFRSPLDIPLYLSGNFGELRSNHFHTGLDIKTDGREGLNVYASADGWVSRIKVSAIGYGMIIYVDHPNGYTSCYAHLSSFNQRIADYTTIKHYQLRSFEVDFPVPAGDIPVAKGEIIGYSGNSGGSGGPHLHFEIRDSKTELALNPLLFGFDIQDDVKPGINAWRAYALNNYSSVNGSGSVAAPVDGRDGDFHPHKKDSVFVHGEVGFALHATDMLTGSGNKCGVYSIELFVDDTLVHRQQMDRLDFNKGRYVNAHTDYKQFQRSKSSIHKCYLEPNNKLPIYPISINRGHVFFSDDKAHAIRFVVKDAYGNTSILQDTVYSTSQPLKNSRISDQYLQEWAWNKAYYPQTADYAFEFPAENIYRNEVIRVTDRGHSPSYHSHVVEIGDDDIPVHANYKIKLDRSDVPDSLLPFVFVAQLNGNNRIVRSAGNKRDGNWITGTAKAFGKFALAIDSVSPTISPVNIAEGKEFDVYQTFSFNASDALTGIAKYDLYIDNNWALIAYDAKYDRFTYTIDPNKILPGIHRLQFVVTDEVGNSRTFECNFLLR